ncbi:hypothetical protein [Streptomyces sp. HNM0574]|uniref:hypothetical protein n=1 Tax=Streptomyces sp. HNM0574 TaxID=2714954 RepID=UPI00146AE757|nr:hypothetical protein [Streptomyces sp. HNM0574]NLU70403.1 hypothetical protein [Streptomyces sp. HNM0574]
MPAQHGDPAAPAPAGETDALGGAEAAAAASGDLREAEAARERALLQAQLSPAWYGPAGALLLSAYGIGMGAVYDADGIGLWPLVGLPVLLAAIALGRIRRRRSGVLVPRSHSRRRGAAVAGVVVFAGVWGVCTLALGLGEQVSLGITGTALGLWTWGQCVLRNVTVRRKLRELA